MRSYAVWEWVEAEAAVDVEAVGWAWAWDRGKEEGEEVDYPVATGNHPELSP
ncbi:MAG: hypothetical protein U9P36_04060 [Thermodesulfobacteriota bacterium]|nr:hypothetical protein [Thermodesulfobacteriota bacterium]